MSSLPAQFARIRDLAQRGRVADAKAACLRLIQQSAGDPGAVLQAAFLLLFLGERDQAIFHARRAATTSPLRKQLAAVLMHHGLFADASEVCLDGLAADPTALPLADIHAMALLNRARVEEAAVFLKEMVARHPSEIGLLGSLAYTLNYLPGASMEETFEAHKRYGAAIEAAAPALPPRTTAAGGTQRRLRIGFLSPDLRTHSVAFFIEPILTHLDRKAFEVACYFTGENPDETTARLRGLADGWCDAAAMSNDQLAALIRADGIDILIELSGLTQGHRLGVMARRSAPVQATYLGYPNTTGLKSVGFRLVDSITDPPRSDRLAIEQLIRIDPCFLCYSPPADAPPLASPPCELAGHITFGSFNAIQKVNGAVLRTWASVLAAVPGSHLLIKGPNLREEPVRREILDRMVSLGVDPARVELVGPSPTADEHLSMYERVDIALDTFPYNGTTTTCEALWMGIPVVTLQGHTHAGRVGASLLSTAGLPELIASSPDEYVRLASQAASSPARLSDLRSSLRRRLAESALCDGPAFAARFAAALRQIAISRPA